MLYCKDHRLNITQLFSNTKGKLVRQNVYAVARGSKKYISTIAICYLAELLNLNSPFQLEQYYLNSKITN